MTFLSNNNSEFKRENAVDRELIKWFAEHDLICVDMLYTQIASNTFLNSRGQNSWIDHIVLEKNELWYEFSQINIDISEKEKNRILNGMEPYEDVVRNNWDCTNYGDHRTLIIDIKTRTNTIRKVEDAPKQRPIDWLNKTHVEKYNCHLNEEIVNFKIVETFYALEHGNIKANCEAAITVMGEVMAKAAELTLIEINTEIAKSMGPHCRRKGWWGPELSVLHERRKIAHSNFLKYRTERYMLALQLIRTELKKVTRDKKRQYKKVEMDRLNNLHKSNRIRFWKKLRTLDTKAEEVAISIEALERYYNKILNERTNDPANDEFDKQIEEDIRKRIEALESKLNSN